MSDRPTPLIVEWPTSIRTDLEMMRAQGLVAVRWEGCSVEVLKRCTLPGSYHYQGITPKHDQVKMSDEASLSAQLPFYGANFGAQLKKAGLLTVSMDIVGSYQASTPGIGPNELQGDCSLATHVVTTMNVGAFEFFSGEDSSQEVAVGISGLGGGANARSAKQVLQQDGDGSNCAEGTDASSSPPPRCTAMLRIEMRPINQQTSSPRVTRTRTNDSTSPSASPSPRRSPNRKSLRHPRQLKTQ